MPVVPPDVRVVAPTDLDAVRESDSLDVVLQATSFRPIADVRAGDVVLTRVGATNRWSGRVALGRGLNVLPLTARDSEGVVGSDTAFVYRLALTQTQMAALPSARGGLTITRLAGGALLAVGGSNLLGAASSDAWTLAPGATRWQPVAGGMTTPRTGHTATLLGDGRVLIVGGSSRSTPTDLSQFVETIEAYDPAAGGFAAVPLAGAPILRARHTAFLRTVSGIPIVELVGGRGNIALLPDRRLGVREDVRSLAVRADRVQALLPSGETGQGVPAEPIEGHATIDVGMPDAPLFRTSGAALIGDEAIRQAFAFVIVRDELRFAGTPLPRIGRFRSAYAAGLQGEMWTAGGQSAGGAIAPDADLYAQRARRSFGVATGAGVFGGAGYSDGAGGLCVIGGFDASGAAVDRHVCWIR